VIGYRTVINQAHQPWEDKSMTFKLLLATREDETLSTNLVDLEEKDLMSGEVTIAVNYSTVNYKDRVVLTGRAPIIRTYPLIPGIDFSGTVEVSSYSGFAGPSNKCHWKKFTAR
jgi:acrylyl-CoA reductase (NADPH)